MKRNEMGRRQFLKRAALIGAGTMGFPCFVRPAALGKDGRVIPSDRITVGCGGMGGRGTNNMRAFMGRKDTQVVAVCDVHADKRSKARDLANRYYGNSDCDAYNDFRELVAREDIDVVSVSTPPHWHAIPSIEAAKSGKDVFCEKPCRSPSPRHRPWLIQSGAMNGCFKLEVNSARVGISGSLANLFVMVTFPSLGARTQTREQN